ncbi:MAG TPA: DegT/DnrJ/EryC1/StrS aminotransferase family protein [Elusimicrobia bacterium]|nr:DegT/DnrJ/EryC1/StrS aminotransferase family protein [Elusimicrobiota bacterium]
MIPVFRPSMGDAETNAVGEVLRSGWIGLGPKTKEFEDKFAAYMNCKYAVAMNSATAALHLAMAVMKVDGGEVITTPMTFVSTNHAILYNSAVPVFCDIEPDTLNIDADKIEALVTPLTKAIVVVHYGGYAVDMDKVLDIAKRRNLKVIEDAAHACGGEYKNRKLGTIGDIGCFSFHAVKNLATGDGGMVTTNDAAIYARLMKLRWVGISKDTWSREDTTTKAYSWYYNIEELGFKYHMNDITAAIGLVQLEKLDTMNRRRAEISRMYTEAFSSNKKIGLPVIKNYMTRPSCHNYVIKVEDRDGLNASLKQQGIATGVHYIPNNNYDMYKGFRGPTPVAGAVWKKLLTLPLFPDLKQKEIELIKSSVLDFIK